MYLPTIGLEIHVELKTNTKMFCSCRNNPDDEKPNVNVCPICLAHPGVLPTINRDAVASVIRLGYAVGGTIASRSHFDRKSYFYPDLPKGYQVTQNDEPLVSGGILKGIRIRRVHLEEDTGRLLHALPGQPEAGSDSTYVDFNRAGVPLMELVTEPDVKTAEEAMAFAGELRLILRYLGVSDADMEKGQMRVEANISVRKNETDEWGTKVEVKNINSFRAVGSAIAYELDRQESVLESGGTVIQETRGWDEVRGMTVSQRSKESAHDYRYFPEPDLPPLDMGSWNLHELEASLPELPEAKRIRLTVQYGMDRKTAETFADNRPLSDYFEASVSELAAYRPGTDTQGLVNYLTSDIRGLMNTRGISIAELKIKPQHLARLVAFIADGKLSSRLAKDLLPKMADTGTDPEELMEDGNIAIVSDDGALREVAKAVIAVNPKAIADFRAGKANAVQFLVGQGMAKTKGQASPDDLRRIVLEELA